MQQTSSSLSFLEATECLNFFRLLRKGAPSSSLFQRSYEVFVTSYQEEFPTELNGGWPSPPSKSFYKKADVICRTIFEGMSRKRVERSLPLPRPIQGLISCANNDMALVDTLETYSLYFEDSLAKIKTRLAPNLPPGGGQVGF